MVYWAPEVLQLQRYNTSADIWALGITMYQIATGEHPFNTSDESEFREQVMNSRVDYSRLAAFSPRL